MRRNDSYTMFGHMETVSLDVSEQEVPHDGNPETASEACSLMADPSLEIISSNSTHSTSMKDEEEPELTLSKYFSSPSEVSIAIPTKGQEFFDALSAVPQVNPGIPASLTELPTSKKLSQQGVESRFPNDPESERCTKTKVSECMMQGDGISIPDKSVKKETEQPDISKYFVQDNGGADAAGKMFFDVIAESKDTTLESAFVNPPPEVVASKNLFNSDHNSFSSIKPEASFLTSVTSPSNDLMHDAWIPSERTRQVLVAMATSTSGSYFPEKECMTMPGVIIEEDMADPVITLLKEANSPMAEERKALTVNDVTQDEEGLKKLIKAGCYHAAVNLTTRLLTAAGQGGHLTKHSPLTLQLWFTRLALLVKLRKFSLVEVESEAFGNLDKPDLYYEFYPDLYAGRKGTMVPFSFRLLLAELPQYQGNHQAALDNLYGLMTVVLKIIHNLKNDRAEDGSMIELTASRRKASLELWTQRECRILYSVLNCVLLQRDYVMAVLVAKILLEKDSEHAHQLHSAMGRIYLQLGDVRAAQASFNRASSGSVNSKNDKAAQAEELVNKALLAVAHNEYEEAYKYFQKAYNLQPENAMLANNIAVCLLYMGRLKQSLAMLEQTVQSRPHECLHDGILFNTCTLYELESSRSTIKKFAMLNLVSTHAGDNFNVSCLKIPTTSKS